MFGWRNVSTLFTQSHFAHKENFCFWPFCVSIELDTRTHTLCFSLSHTHAHTLTLQAFLCEVVFVVRAGAGWAKSVCVRACVFVCACVCYFMCTVSDTGRHHLDNQNIVCMYIHSSPL